MHIEHNITDIIITLIAGKYILEFINKHIV